MTVNQILVKLSALGLPEAKYVVDDYFIEGFIPRTSLKRLQNVFPNNVEVTEVKELVYQRLQALYNMRDPVTFKIYARGTLDRPEPIEEEPVVEFDYMQEALYSIDQLVKVSVGRVNDDSEQCVAFIIAEDAQGRTVAKERYEFTHPVVRRGE